MTPLPDAINLATARLLDTVDSLADDKFAEPSLLPGWSIGHVVAHLALNAEGITQVLQGVAAGEVPPMYRSPEIRDQEIEELAGQDPDELRTRLSVGSTLLTEQISVIDPRDDDVEFPRAPGHGPMFRVGTMPLLRLREVEIHHADLGVGYTHREWPEETVVRLLDHASGAYAGTPFTAYATDLDRRWEFAGGGAAVEGVGSALAWWTTGRGPEGISADGELPRIEGR
ncbi:maleylpyruvate isomerase family mycothiol-dependent enzyme [Nocardioides panacisoli]|uniref:maleylpyruvate isomerase family mycothiol-dependent enzyme n=1 Tax=Nocardioides panacisoli TaxID=627624 RepID=UPI001C628960|nr:maleylpyruvate isomerase family mycothiol-dependent enzyme [Nocardioides panacisoli]QYJ04958.1 maleylpyruvate isomerase family mycothiol-dependent enzyme [Nocardioides panacisoli]